MLKFFTSIFCFVQIVFCFNSIAQENTWSQLASGLHHTLAIKSDSSLWAWGWNSDGQVGDNTNVDRSSPKLINESDKWIAISAKESASAAIKKDHTLWTWGGILNRTSLISQLEADKDWSKVSVGNYVGLAIKQDSTLWAWGDNMFGNFGGSDLSSSELPIKIGNDHDWVEVLAEGSYSLALKKDSSLWVCGANVDKVLGSGLAGKINYFKQIGIDNKWTRISGGKTTFLALDKESTLWQFGVGTTGILQLSKEKWTSISGNEWHNCGIKPDSTLWEWGLRFDSNVRDTFPVKHQDDKWVVAVAGGYHTLALKKDRLQLCGKGYNGFGAFGNGTRGTSSKDFNCSTGNPITAIDASPNNTANLTIQYDPATMNVRVHGENENHCQILNELGVIVRVCKFNSSNNYSENISDLANGFYILSGNNLFHKFSIRK